MLLEHPVRFFIAMFILAASATAVIELRDYIRGEQVTCEGDVCPTHHQP